MGGPAATGSGVFVRVPECAVVCGIHIERTVIAPTLIGLRSGTGDQDGLALGESARRVSLETAVVADARRERCTSGAVSDDQIPFLIRGCAGHPATVGIGRVGSFLGENPAPPGIPPKFPPPNSRMIGAVDIRDVAPDKALVSDLVAVLNSPHDHFTQGIQSDTAVGLGNARKTAQPA